MWRSKVFTIQLNDDVNEEGSIHIEETTSSYAEIIGFLDQHLAINVDNILSVIMEN